MRAGDGSHLKISGGLVDDGREHLEDLIMPLGVIPAICLVVALIAALTFKHVWLPYYRGRWHRE